MTGYSGTDGLASALFRLLYHRTVRQCFMRGETQSLMLCKQDLSELETIDLVELEATAKTIARNMLSGNSGGGGGLRQSFPITLSLLENAGITSMDVMYRFLEAPQFRFYRELPHAGIGLSAEEAFYNFLMSDEELLSLSSLLGFAAKHEILTTLLSMLVVTNRPNFRVETSLICDNGVCRFACPLYSVASMKEIGLKIGETGSQATAVHYLYAATARHFISGPVTPLITTLLDIGSVDDIRAGAADLGDRVRQPISAIVSTAEALERRGLIK
jgi:hypothetical protein